MTLRADTPRIAEAIKRPGIDPRDWLEEGVIAHGVNLKTGEFLSNKSDVVKDDFGYYARVVLVPSMVKLFCKIALPYVGKGATIYLPYHPLDTVLVAIPSGNLMSQPTIIGRKHTGADPLPPGVDTENAWLVLEDGATLNIITKGKVTINANDNPVQVIGSGVTVGQNQTDHMMRGESYQSNYERLLDLLASHVHPDPQGGSTGPSPTLATITSPSPIGNKFSQSGKELSTKHQVE